MWRRRWERRGARGHSAAAGGRRWQAALGACPVPPSASQVPKAVRGSITSCPNCRTPARSAWRMRRGCTPHAGRCDPDRALLAPTARAGRTQACASHVRGAAAVAPAPLFPFSRVNARSARARPAPSARTLTLFLLVTSERCPSSSPGQWWSPPSAPPVSPCVAAPLIARPAARCTARSRSRAAAARPAHPAGHAPQRSVPARHRPPAWQMRSTHRRVASRARVPTPKSSSDKTALMI